MGPIVALAVGYVVGARSGGKSLDDLLRAARAVRQSDEFTDLVSAARVHLAHTMREMATIVEHGVTPGATDDTGGDLIERVSQLVGRR
jgi:hypothetical protein